MAKKGVDFNGDWLPGIRHLAEKIAVQMWKTYLVLFQNVIVLQWLPVSRRSFNMNRT